MKTFFLQFKTVPTVNNQYYDLIAGGYSACWVIENNSYNAYIKAKFETEKANWKIESIEIEPIEVNEENFFERDIGLEKYREAQKKLIAIAYTCYPKDENKITEYTELAINKSYDFDLQSLIKKQKALSNKGRCLHYESGNRCNEIIQAHSIQKSRVLELIAEKGHAYVISNNIGDLKKNNGKISYKKRGIGDISIFRGFCGYHDNVLFEPIDNSPLIPTNQQIFLYAYRSLCKEYFIKENALNSLNHLLENCPNNKAIRELSEGSRYGTEIGLNSLKIHKDFFDESLKKGKYDDINYHVFISRQKPTIVFSNLFSPDFDFMGRKLQDVTNPHIYSRLITICFAPMNNNKWGLILAWHKSSADICNPFIGSLTEIAYRDRENINDKMGEYLFRLIISGCENIAVSPAWWDNLPKNKKEAIIHRQSSMVDVMSIIEPDYLMNGLEGISDWNFENVISNKQTAYRIKSLFNKVWQFITRFN